MTQTIRALTLDLDDTLWPIWPAIERAEAVLHAWLAAHAPATAGRYGIAALRELCDAVGRSRGDWAHDLSALRRESLRLALADAGDDPALAEPAFECFFAERQKVDLFDDVLPALERLASRYPLLALSNGNADIARIGLARYFRGSLSAR
ncbi:MAG TPA: HAD family hydrolase, partial [Methylibium sp.]